MSRKIEYRVWDNLRGCYANHMNTFLNQGALYYRHWGEEEECKVISPYDHDDIIIEQYTGLKDKNGKEIYEGDIVEGDMGVFEVKWYDLVAQFMFRPNIDMKWHPPFVSDQVKEMEVIGNIHESPKDFRPAHLKRTGASISKGGDNFTFND